MVLSLLTSSFKIKDVAAFDNQHLKVYIIKEKFFT